MKVKAKKEGKGSVVHKPVISSDDMSKIQESLDLSTPGGLQDKVFLDVLTFYCHRGRENIREMKAEDFTIKVDDSGRKYVQMRDFLTKNNRENVIREADAGLMFEIPELGERCPVATFEKYVAKLNPQNRWMWQRPKDVSKKELAPDAPWFDNAPLGINTIGNKLKNLSQKAGCKLTYTNHSLRATSITTLDACGYEARDIQSVSGHKSADSLKHYSKTSQTKLKKMSESLATCLYSDVNKDNENQKLGNQESTSSSKAIAECPGPSSAMITTSTTTSSSQETVAYGYDYEYDYEYNNIVLLNPKPN